MNDFLNSDLAIEQNGGRSFLDSVAEEYSEEENEGCTICTLDISTDELSEKYGRRKGRYITIFCNKIWLADEYELDSISRVVSYQIDEMCKMIIKNKRISELSVLVAGLGNIDITSDALGPLVLGELNITRHMKEIYKNILGKSSFASVCALQTGVLAKTGIESSVILKEVSDSVKPDLIIVVDALASRSTERLGSTVQISDAGISPGAGIGNTQGEISERVLGVPVIALGVPTVVNSATLVCDVLERAGIEINDNRLSKILDVERKFFVSPKECDIIVRLCAKMLASAINRCFGVL